MRDSTEEAFVDFVRSIEAGLRSALIGRHGADRGREAANDALVVGWREWDRVSQMENPAGYLYRIGHRRALRRRLLPAPAPASPTHSDPWVEPGLPTALADLSTRQRQIVMLIEGFEYTFREVAALLGLSVSSVQTHHDRGMYRLRTALGVEGHE